MRRIVPVFAAVIMMLAFTFPAFAQDNGIQIREISAKELKKALDTGKKLLVIDARTKEEYAEGHIPGAINISPDKVMFIAGYLPPEKDYPMVFYCRGGG
jgi:phage shock protein E